MNKVTLYIPSAIFALNALSNAAITPIGSYSSYDGGEGTGWTGIGYSISDPTTDHQTGGVEGDLVGNDTVPFFYTAFDDNGAVANDDGTISFRTRHGGDPNPAGYKGVLSIGIDANSDGIIDGFVGVNNSGNKDGIYLWNASSVVGDNLSVLTLVFGEVYKKTSLTPANYDFREVETADLGTGVSLDLDGDAGAKALIDTYLSFSVDFGDLVTMLEEGVLANSSEVVNITQETGLSYVVSTSTQANNFNQDTGGLDGTTGEGTLFTDSGGAISDPYTAPGTVAVPEPSSTCLIGTCILFLMRRKRP